MKNRPVRLTTLLLGLAAATASAQGSRPDSLRLVAGIDSIVASYEASNDFSGVVLIADHGQVIYERAAGLANREWRVPMRTDAVFRIGSTTKQFTAALVMSFVEEGRLRLDAHVSDYLPDYPARSGRQITLRQLLTHTSGIPEYVVRDSFLDKFAPGYNSPASLVARFARLPLEFTPGSRWSYSNSNFVLLGAILERVSGRSYSDLVASRLAGPLGMTSLSVDDETVLPLRTDSYVSDGKRLYQGPHVNASAAFGAGSLRITARDLLVWDQALYEGRMFRDSITVRELFLPRIATGTPLGQYGYAFFIGDQKLGAKSVKVIQHGGTISGFYTGFWRMPDERRTIIVLSSVHGPRTTQLIGALADRLYR